MRCPGGSCFRPLLPVSGGFKSPGTHGSIVLFYPTAPLRQQIATLE
jgi:hypothetical protein